jgi:carboxyl-terminal processing protease
MQNSKSNWYWASAGLLAGTLLTASCVVTAGKYDPLATRLKPDDLHRLAEVLTRVEENYVDPVADDQLISGALRGMLGSLDPYSEYLGDEEFEDLKVSTTGEYSGVGIEVALRNDEVVIVAPIEDTPAALAGIRAGDVLTAIDGHALDTTSLASAIARMRGKIGSPVTLTIRRAGEEEPLQFILRRARVEVHSVKFELPRPGQGYVRISHFSETTAGDLNTALTKLITKNAGPLKGLVLDLRDNPGGVLDSSVEVADAFLDSGVIVSARGRTEQANFTMQARPGDRLGGAPLIVLVDGGSASASEVVAGALHDHHRALLLGAATFGKGSVQTLLELSDGHAIKLTTARYFTPSGASINATGIKPDILWTAPATGTLPAAGTAESAAKPLLERDPEVRRAFDELTARAAAIRATTMLRAAGRPAQESQA